MSLPPSNERNYDWDERSETWKSSKAGCDRCKNQGIVCVVMMMADDLVKCQKCRLDQRVKCHPNFDEYILTRYRPAIINAIQASVTAACSSDSDEAQEPSQSHLDRLQELLDEMFTVDAGEESEARSETGLVLQQQLEDLYAKYLRREEQGSNTGSRGV